MLTNIEIDEDLLMEAMKYTNLTSKKEVINFLLDDYIKLQKRKLLLDLRGKINWEGNLNEMRTYDKWEDS